MEKNKNVRLFARLSTSSMSEEEMEFVNDKLKNLSKTQLVREAIKAYYRLETGEVFKELLRSVDIGNSNDDEEKEKINKELNEYINKNFIK